MTKTAGRPVLWFTLTVLERATLGILIAHSEVLMAALLAQRTGRLAELAPALMKAIEAYGAACADAHGEPEDLGAPNETDLERIARYPSVVAARTALEVEIRASVGVMEKGELVVRALASLGGLDSDRLRDRIRGADLKFHVVPPTVPCPGCTDRRVAAPAGKCATCHGKREIGTVIPPEHRVHTDAELRERFGGAGPAGANGGPSIVLADASGRVLSP
jgi:hypothetical protein